MAEAFIFWPHWHYVWFGLAIAASIAALFLCSWETFIVSLMLLIGWFLTTLFWQIVLVYIISDICFGAMTFGLWWRTREGHLLFIATMYASMLVVHAISPGFPQHMVALNALFGAQLAAVSRAAIRRTPQSGGGAGRVF